MADTFNNKKNIGLRGSGAYKAAPGDFEIARRIGGGKAMDLRSEPQSETERALSHSRQLLAQMRRMVANP